MTRLLLIVPLIACCWGPALRAADVPATIKKTGDRLELQIKNAPLAEYRYAGEVPTGGKGDTNKPLAKPFFYPLKAPNGVIVTRGWPVVQGTPGETTDHVHQKSAWFCHGDVIPDGKELKVRSADKRVHGVDFWSEGGNHGRIVCTSVEIPESVTAPYDAVAKTQNTWQAADGMKLLTEHRLIGVKVLPTGYLLALEIDLHASECGIIFGDTKEGSMGVRVNDTFRLNGPNSDGLITSAEGETAKAPARDNLPMWGKASDWHDYSGTVDGKKAGIAIFDDARNAHRAAWHTRAYGLMAANPFGRAGSFPAQKGNTDLVKLAKGEHLKLRYGIYVHDGDAQAGQVAEAYKLFMGK